MSLAYDCKTEIQLPKAIHAWELVNWITRIAKALGLRLGEDTAEGFTEGLASYWMKESREFNGQEGGLVPIDTLQALDLGDFMFFRIIGVDASYVGDPSVNESQLIIWQAFCALPDDSPLTDRIFFEYRHPWLQYVDVMAQSSEGEFSCQYSRTAAAQYYSVKCMMRATQATSGTYLTSWDDRPGDCYEEMKKVPFVFRPGQISKVIPVLEDYCDEIGYACVDNPELPVVRVAPFSNTEVSCDPEARVLPPVG